MLNKLRYLLWSGGLLMGLTLAKGAQAATTYPIDHIQVTTAQTYVVQAAHAQGYHITVLPHHRVKMRANLHLNRQPATVWTREEQAEITQHGKKHLYYYLKNERGQSGWVAADQVRPTSIALDVPVVSQLPDLPTGCEITAVDMLLQYAGAKTTKNQLADELPRTDDPNTGFVGDPYSEVGVGLYVYPQGILPTMRKYVSTAFDFTGRSLNELKVQLTKGHPVVVWVANVDGFASHALTVTGFNATDITYNDPWTGQREQMPTAEFERVWQDNGRRAVSY
ncbi:C39 family peptidase [Lactiplantibacillus fabifermentans]|uniref:Peptidase C39-like domain-containing protein n=2 Tax=Lactiplantibacillus fabifermentans TaxID=483011 RepID=A0A0R2NFT0_9LACO|nr:C39 family peptidase [Lactiplantibacillus fabifermentans]ETY75188.1 hypothetical protein LFAB_02665 [Lactiplantibacillus fabifermentans T30PCM01]KRO22499.1 hypothetical protein DY78_GL002018 [Lactiplantibacillus fabifermentans DSM 21115]